MNSNKVAWIHIDILTRAHEFGQGTYPKSHLWGYPLEKKSGRNTLNPLISSKLIQWICKTYNSLTKNRLGNLLIELSLLKDIRQLSCIYCVSGRLFWIPLLKGLGLINAKLVILIYRLPENSPWWKLHDLHLSKYILNNYDGINCLTKKTETNLKVLLKKDGIQIQYIPWGTDHFFFKRSCSVNKSIFFFASGKTNRDYKTLVRAANKLPDIQFILIGHFDIDESNGSNIHIIKSSTSIPDKAIDYDELKLHYADCYAVCIPLNEDTNDTCGYTEMLESMAMGKPVLMTKSGCLDINLEEENCGLYLKPNDPGDWAEKIKLLAKNKSKRSVMGENGRNLVESTYNSNAYEKRIEAFLSKIVTRIQP